MNGLFKGAFQQFSCDLLGCFIFGCRDYLLEMVVNGLFKLGFNKSLEPIFHNPGNGSFYDVNDLFGIKNLSFHAT